ncbi:hypothetical protein [Streptomyces sp. NBC_00338]|uniref:hypothetical protein n=1 Tax=Streptomyces sp. NBC_00338 TaxID=2975715 RepID=UPI00225A45F8|nr:hypothetical protein [Streptomyces sp. NBC_00338]MCX5144635.1 hypothetical protein [Streptomyces sp. NBC_00338]MCX5145069.1 hypothetical protein [Streptomyces sp. NBC_00338]
MARTGPQKIPGASQQHFFGTGQYSGSDMEINCGVVHTTEGRTLTTYGAGAMAPTATGLPDIKNRKLRWYQHYDVDESARALENKLGGVETNTANAFQIELVGTCDAKHAKSWDGKVAGVDYIYWPDAPDWALAEVAWLVGWLYENHGVPLSCVKDWLAYGADTRRPGVTPASYGASPARMSMAEWRNFRGWCGHQHVPENAHGDPGSMDFARVIALATGTNIPPKKEDDMPLTDADVKRILTTDGIVPAPSSAADYKTNKFWTVASHLATTTAAVRDLQKTQAAQTAAITALAKLAGANVDTKTVVTAVQKAIADAVIKVDVDINGPGAS